MKQYIDTIDKISDDVLAYIIQHPNDFSWNFLAISIIVTRLNLQLSIRDTKEVLENCCAELRSLLLKSIHVPNAQKDIMKIGNLQREQQMANC
jgi:hypothetical protein